MDTTFKKNNMSVYFAKRGNDFYKVLRSPEHNYDFNLRTGEFARWGKTVDDDPQCGFPEIADIEVSEVCHGVKGAPCAFCYKSNTDVGRNMSLELYKKVLDKLPITVTQVALGIGDIDGNPDLRGIILETRKRGIVPNITINGDRLTDDWVQFFAKNLGAIAVSLYDKDTTYNAVKRLTDAGMAQVNIHSLLAKETHERCMSAIDDKMNDSRLSKMNAIVFLSLKQKGRGCGYSRCSDEEFLRLVTRLRETHIGYGCDSCTANRLIWAYGQLNAPAEEMKMIETVADPCESSLFSQYANTEGKFFPCSFTEGEPGWEEGLDIPSCNDFMTDIWMHPRVVEFRQKLLACKRSCPIFKV